MSKLWPKYGVYFIKREPIVRINLRKKFISQKYSQLYTTYEINCLKFPEFWFRNSYQDYMYISLPDFYFFFFKFCVHFFFYLVYGSFVVKYGNFYIEFRKPLILMKENIFSKSLKPHLFHEKTKFRKIFLRRPLQYVVHRVGAFQLLSKSTAGHWLRSA